MILEGAKGLTKTEAEKVNEVRDVKEAKDEGLCGLEFQ